MNALAHILNHKIVAILRGANPKDVLKIVEALHRGGVQVLEITLNSPSALSLIETIHGRLGDHLLVGAGTVMSAAEAASAVSAGAKFIISPMVEPGTIRQTKDLGAVSIPGAFSPTEIATAYAQGADIIKLFPATLGPDYIKNLRGPFPDIPFMPTGGINLDNIRAYQQAGAVAFGIGTALADTKRAITGEYLAQITEHARKLVQAVNT